MTADKIITHEDRDVIKLWGSLPLEGVSPEVRMASELLYNRLIAAAEADMPPLPEGWVLLRNDHGDHRTLWHRDHNLYHWNGGSRESNLYGEVGSRGIERHRLTPLRPTVTEEDVERAAAAYRQDYYSLSCHWQHLSGDSKRQYIDAIRAALKAAGIEVTP